MAFSIYEIDAAQDIPKPSSVIDMPNYYLQDVFYNTRPVTFNFQNQPGEGEPYYKYYTEDQAVKENIKDEFKDNYRDQNIFNDSNEPLFVHGAIDDTKRLLSLYNLEYGRCANLSYVFGPNKSSRTAVSLGQLVRETSDYSVAKAGGCTAAIITRATNKNKGHFVYRVRCTEDYSVPAGHLVTVQLNPSEGQTKILHMDVKISCTCDFWKFQGPDYHAKDKYLEGDQLSDGSKPTIKDPNGRNFICKHVFVVHNIFKNFAYQYIQRKMLDIKKLMNELAKETTPDLLDDVEALWENLDEKAQKKLSPLFKKLQKNVEDEKTKQQIMDTLKTILPEQKPDTLEQFKDELKKPKKKRKEKAPIKHKTMRPELILNEIIEELKTIKSPKKERDLKKFITDHITKNKYIVAPNVKKDIIDKALESVPKRLKRSSDFRQLIIKAVLKKLEE